ncbi:MAG TPA: acyl-CoA thioester hydrolase/BAAT C-terminal domain-containing protein [Pyrinomonadaceae bacterium]|jgi:tetratricopeptide (TPR) repeat protein
MIRLVFFLITLFCFSNIISAQTFPLWGDLKPGKYSVGYRAMHKYDRARTFIPERSYEGKLYTGERSRPLQIQIFYPARVSPNAARMSYQEYLNFKADTPVAATVVEGLQHRTQEIHDFFQRRYLQDYKNGLYDRLMKMPTAAVKNAPAENGRFPIILYGGGTEMSTDENVILWEYLASHGYIVAVVPMMGAYTVSSYADAIGFETQTRDMEFLFEQARELPNADTSRIGAMGFSFSGQAALLMAMRNPDIKAVVGLDPSFISKFYSQFLKNSPFYNVDSVVVPVLEMHRRDASTVFYEITDALKYSERYSFDINDLNHIDFTSFALLYTAVLPEQAKQNSPISARKTAYEAMSRYILDFLDVQLKGEKAKSEDLKKPAEWKGYPRETVSFRYLKALPAPPSYAELMRIFREQGSARGEQIYREVLKREPDAKVISETSINYLGYALMGTGKPDEAVRALQLNVERFPKSANAYDSLADAYKKKGNHPCVVYAYRKLLEVLPKDTAFNESQKTSLQQSINEQLNKLKGVSPANNCVLQNR